MQSRVIGASDIRGVHSACALQIQGCSREVGIWVAKPQRTDTEDGLGLTCARCLQSTGYPGTRAPTLSRVLGATAIQGFSVSRKTNVFALQETQTNLGTQQFQSAWNLRTLVYTLGPSSFAKFPSLLWVLKRM